MGGEICRLFVYFPLPFCFLLFVFTDYVCGDPSETNEGEAVLPNAALGAGRRAGSAERVDSLFPVEDAEIRENATKLPLRFQLQKPQAGVQVETRDFFRSWALEMKAAGNAGPLRLEGGHCFFPANGTNRELRDEIRWVANETAALQAAFRSVGVPIRALEYRLLLVLDEQSSDGWNDHEFLHQAFGNAVEIESTNRSVCLLSHSNETHVNVTIFLITNVEDVRENTRLPIGRSDFEAAVREMHRVEGSGFEEEVFLPGKTRVYRTIYSPLYLEDFLHKPNTAAVLEKELQMLAWGMDALVDAFAASNLTLHSVFVQIFLVFPEEAFEEANFSSKISELFPADAITNGTSAKNVAIFRQLDYVEICLELSATSDFRTVRSLTSLAEGYSEDFTGASRVGGWNVSSFGENFRLPDW
ncbi:hypothetical protein M3Y99_00472600 [Aphelenchoides fujianensis]|nr:hypothetical protein M3Y99_00472600 [Aphelenchoides fujianensis]